MVLHLTKSNDAAVNESEGKDSQHQIQPEADMHAALGYNPYEPHQEADNDKRITERTEQSYPLAPAAITDEIESGIGHEIFDRCIEENVHHGTDCIALGTDIKCHLQDEMEGQCKHSSTHQPSRYLIAMVGPTYLKAGQYQK